VTARPYKIGALLRRILDTVNPSKESNDSYVDLTVISGYGQGLLIVTGLVMLGIALAVFG
jgi:hypothetical protein